MRVFVLLLASVACFCVSECSSNCSCEDTTCICNWARISVGDWVCLFSADGTDCFPVESTGLPDDVSSHTSTGIGCSCSSGECICTWAELAEDAEVCLSRPEGMLCHSVEMVEGGVIRTRRSTIDHICRCNDNGCFCDLEKAMDTEEICLQRDTTTTCVPVSNLQDDTKVDGCTCKEDKCSCRWKKIEDNDSICLKSLEELSCKPAKIRKRFARFLSYDDYCSCNRTGCECVFSRAVTKTGEICHESSTGLNCAPIKNSTKSMDGISVRMSTDNSNECKCEGGNCFCNWGDVVEGDRICLKETDYTFCATASKRRRDKILVNGVECTCGDGVCWCDMPRPPWRQKNRDVEICRMSSSGEECYKDKTQESSGGQRKPGLPKRGCVCQKDGCTCKFKEIEVGDIICFKSSSDEVCQKTKVLGGGRNRKKCTCKEEPCKCDWYNSEDDDKKSRASDRRYKKQGNCECYEGMCVCNLRSRPGISRSINDICVKQPGSPECVPATQLSRGRVSCACNEEKVSCMCDWNKSDNGDEICVNLSSGMECEPVGPITSSDRNRLKKDCKCWWIFCTCKFAALVISFRSRPSICVTSDKGKGCKPAAELADRSAMNGVYCTLDGAGYKCGWEKSQHVEEICLKNGGKDICQTPEDLTTN